MRAQQPLRCEDHARCADTTLSPAALQEALLDSVQVPVRAYAFDGADLGILCLQRRHKAGVHELAIHEHGARSTFTFPTAFLGSSEP